MKRKIAYILTILLLCGWSLGAQQLRTASGIQIPQLNDVNQTEFSLQVLPNLNEERQTTLTLRYTGADDYYLTIVQRGEH